MKTKILKLIFDKTEKEERLDWALLALRIVIGLFFINHGWMKISGVAGLEGFSKMLLGLNLPAPELLAYLVFITEFLGGIAVILGVLVRFSTFWQMIILLEIVFKVKGGELAKNELELLAFSGALVLFLVGPGKYSLANYLSKFFEIKNGDKKLEGQEKRS